MTIPDGVPYAPYLFERNSYTVSATLLPIQLADNNSRRVGLYICTRLIAVAADPHLAFGGSGGGEAILRQIDTSNYVLYWEQYYTLVGLQVFAVDYIPPTVFSVTEIILNKQEDKELYHVVRKPQTLAAKIKRYFMQQ